MRSLKQCSGEYVVCHLLITIVAAVLLHAIGAFSVAAPNTGCYALDNSSHIHDFSSWIGQPFEYEGKGKVMSDLILSYYVHHRFWLYEKCYAHELSFNVGC